MYRREIWDARCLDKCGTSVDRSAADAWHDEGLQGESVAAVAAAARVPGEWMKVFRDGA